MVQWQSLRLEGVEQFIGDRSEVVGFNVKRSVVSMGFWNNVEPGLRVKGLGLDNL